MRKRSANEPAPTRDLGFRHGTLDERVESVTRRSIDTTVKEITRRAAERFIQRAI